MLKRIFGRRRQSNTASIAKERLQIIVAHERIRNADAHPDFMQDLQKDILEVVRKYLPVDGKQVKIEMDREEGCDVLELNIILSDNEDEASEVSENVDQSEAKKVSSDQDEKN